MRTSTSAPASAISSASTSTSVDLSAGSSAVNDSKFFIPTNAAAASRILAMSSGSLTHQTSGFANAVRRREIWYR